MADPRATTNRIGTEPEVVRTYAIDGSTITYSATAIGGSDQVGLACRIKPGTAGVVETVGDAEAVLGKILEVFDDGFASIQVGGVVTLPGGNGATLTAGSRIVGALNPSSAEGYIRSVAAATLAEVAVARHTIDDPTTATAVVVSLQP